MNVLIIEDSKYKVEAIREFLNLNYHCSISFAYSYNSGMRMLKSNEYDIVLLDMTMHTFDLVDGESGGRQRPFAGLDILRQSERSKLKFKTIVITQFEHFGKGKESRKLDEISNILEKDYSDYFIGIIHFDMATDEWSNNLRKMMEEI